MDNEKKRILIVEDEFIVAADIRMTLQRLNYNVTSSIDNGADAIRITELEKPDLVLMDITLKGNLDGIETAKIIMSRFKIPIIYLSALNDEQTIYKALSTKPFGYLIKPFAPIELHAAIESVFVKLQVF